ncbi:hypothetical protein AVEN_203730-1 [Araneus ventricosus]|uniref:Uncharacterized protein n=1 Tax=Araneus ventricosus TaxID=182803 RepID=A0A4Y2RST1_ARAVE|nr:hypothetical protein AVEN_203730-1 [Araneus ventricosus]
MKRCASQCDVINSSALCEPNLMLSSNLGSESQQPSPATPQPTEGGTFHHWWRITQPPPLLYSPGEARTRLLIRRLLIHVLLVAPWGGDNSSESVLRDELIKDIIILLTKF